MPGVLLPIFVMLLISAGAGMIAVIVAQRNRNAGIVIAVGSAVVLVLHAAFLNDELIVAQMLPWANAMFYGDSRLPVAALLAGSACSLLRTPPWQRVVLTVALIAFALYRVLGPIIGAPPAGLQNRWTNGICRQSTTSTCSAAAAATALHSVGIETTESEMAQLCLTRSTGTSTLGLYRGLKLKTAGTAYTVAVYSGPVEGFLALPAGPALVSIGAAQRVENSQNAGRQFSLLPGGSHSVTVLGVGPDGTIDVADPFSGRQHMTRANLEMIWGGEAIRIVRR
jgi:hypothetical protein